MAWMLPKSSGGILGLGGVDRAEIGLPSDDEYIASYCRRTGREGIENWNFYIVFCFFRLAAILQGIKKRAEIGTASSAEASSRAAMVAPLAEAGVSFIE
jgi:aminoglycoside phosphotransferase (APT) family kinase protein